MTWFDSTTPYRTNATTSRSAVDRLFHTQDVGVRLPPRRLWPRSEVVETPGRGPGGSRFESDRSPCEGTGCSGVSYALHAGSIPALATKRAAHRSGPVAQLEAQLPCKEKVGGSSPARS